MGKLTNSYVSLPEGTRDINHQNGGGLRYQGASHIPNTGDITPVLTSKFCPLLTKNHESAKWSKTAGNV